GMFPAAFETLSASAEKSRAAPPIPNANTEAVPRINFRIIVISRVSDVGKSSSYYPNNLAANRVPRGQLCQI
ncbi:MAG: hypothetical protein WCA23_15180, partial [Stellaceae bacterium]